LKNQIDTFEDYLNKKMKLRIHGDNIIECERTLSLITLAYNGKVVAKSKNITSKRIK
jgi:hypothetical protein